MLILYLLVYSLTCECVRLVDWDRAKVMADYFGIGWVIYVEGEWASGDGLVLLVNINHPRSWGD